MYLYIYSRVPKIQSIIELGFTNIFFVINALQLIIVISMKCKYLNIRFQISNTMILIMYYHLILYYFKF
jgi:hypothetical protein